MAVIVAILVFGLLILIHEFGHYLTARMFHVEIHEFSIGMGPKLFSYRSRRTGIRYSLRLLPFGGFVSMPGELGEDPDARPRFGFEAVPPLVEEAEPDPDEIGYTIANKGNTLANTRTTACHSFIGINTTNNTLISRRKRFNATISISARNKRLSLSRF